MTTTTPAAADLYLLDEQLTAEERDVRSRVRAFAERDIGPVAQDYWDRAAFPADLLPGLAALGVVGGAIDGYGCAGMSSVAYGLALQEIARVDGSMATFMASHSNLTMNGIYYCGTEEQRRRWLPAMARLETIGAFALTEPDVGSDAARLQTRAVRDGDSYVLNGRKRWIGNGTICDVALVWAMTDDGAINGFLVPRDTLGYRAEIITDKLSTRSVWQADMTLDGCRIPAENHLSGKPGFAGTATVLMHARLGVAWSVLGQAMACYEAALAYARERRQFGKPIAAFQLVQEKLVRMLNGITLAQLACLHVSRLRDRGRLTPAMVSLLKMNHSEMAREVALHARDILGANGILGEYGVMRHLCDLEGPFTYEGTHDINMLVVGREITGLSAFR